MARTLAVVVAFAALGLSGISPGFGQASVVTRIGLDQTRIIRTQEPIGGIAVGNTSIVTVALHDLQTVILTGRAPGVTSLTVMDTTGRVMQETRLIVPVSVSDGISITRGNQTSAYVCDTTSCVLRSGRP